MRSKNLEFHLYIGAAFYRSPRNSNSRAFLCSARRTISKQARKSASRLRTDRPGEQKKRTAPVASSGVPIGSMDWAGIAMTRTTSFRRDHWGGPVGNCSADHPTGDGRDCSSISSAKAPMRIRYRWFAGCHTVMLGAITQLMWLNGRSLPRWKNISSCNQPFRISFLSEFRSPKYSESDCFDAPRR